MLCVGYPKKLFIRGRSEYSVEFWSSWWEPQRPNDYINWVKTMSGICSIPLDPHIDSRKDFGWTFLLVESLCLSDSSLMFAIEYPIHTGEIPVWNSWTSCIHHVLDIQIVSTSQIHHVLQRLKSVCSLSSWTSCRSFWAEGQKRPWTPKIMVFTVMMLLLFQTQAMCQHLWFPGMKDGHPKVMLLHRHVDFVGRGWSSASFSVSNLFGNQATNFQDLCISVRWCLMNLKEH